MEQQKMNKLIFVILVCFGLSIAILYTQQFTKKADVVKQPTIITLKEYEIAYSSESSRTFLLDRKTNEIKYILSDTLSQSIFLIVSNSLMKEYDKTIKK